MAGPSPPDCEFASTKLTMTRKVARAQEINIISKSAERAVECVVAGLSIAYHIDGKWLRAVRNVSFDVSRGQILAIVGETGSGKSSIGKALMRILPYQGRVVSGSVKIEGQEMLALSERELRQLRGKYIGYVPQQPSAAFNPTMTIGRQVAEALVVHGGFRYRDATEVVCKTLAGMGLREPERLVRAYPHQLSGGMLQRAMIASALIAQPRMLIADEPTSALDVRIQRQILDLLRRVRDERGLATVLITHDLGAVAEIADLLMVLYAGRMVEFGPADRVLTSPRHPYTKGLIESSPGRGQAHKSRLTALPGAPLGPFEVDCEAGCPFRSRCSRANADCIEGFPKPRNVGDHQWYCHHPEVHL